MQSSNNREMSGGGEVWRGGIARFRISFYVALPVTQYIYIKQTCFVLFFENQTSTTTHKMKVPRFSRASLQHQARLRTCCDDPCKILPRFPDSRGALIVCTHIPYRSNGKIKTRAPERVTLNGRFVQAGIPRLSQKKTEHNNLNAASAHYRTRHHFST